MLKTPLTGVFKVWLFLNELLPAPGNRILIYVYLWELFGNKGVAGPPCRWSALCCSKSVDLSGTLWFSYRRCVFGQISQDENKKVKGNLLERSSALPKKKVVTPMFAIFQLRQMGPVSTSFVLTTSTSTPTPYPNSIDQSSVKILA